jgi:hypothetical protein
MSSDVFRKVGRGGAGNFYSKKDIEDAEKATSAVCTPKSNNYTRPIPFHLHGCIPPPQETINHTVANFDSSPSLGNEQLNQSLTSKLKKARQPRRCTAREQGQKPVPAAAAAPYRATLAGDAGVRATLSSVAAHQQHQRRHRHQQQEVNQPPPPPPDRCPRIQRSKSSWPPPRRSVPE